MSKSGRVKKVPEAYDPSEISKVVHKKPTAPAIFSIFKAIEQEKASVASQLNDVEHSILELESKYLNSGKKGFGNAITGRLLLLYLYSHSTTVPPLNGHPPTWNVRFTHSGAYYAVDNDSVRYLPCAKFPLSTRI